MYTSLCIFSWTFLICCFLCPSLFIYYSNMTCVNTLQRLVKKCHAHEIRGCLFAIETPLILEPNHVLWYKWYEWSGSYAWFDEPIVADEIQQEQLDLQRPRYQLQNHAWISYIIIYRAGDTAIMKHLVRVPLSSTFAKKYLINTEHILSYCIRIYGNPVSVKSSDTAPWMQDVYKTVKSKGG